MKDPYDKYKTCFFFSSGFDEVWFGAHREDSGYQFTDGSHFDHHVSNQSLNGECLMFIGAGGVSGNRCETKLPFLCMLNAGQTDISDCIISSVNHAVKANFFVSFVPQLRGGRWGGWDWLKQSCR